MRFWGQLGLIFASKNLKNRVLEATWTVLGTSWAVLEASWAVSGWSWTPIGPSWAVLGRLGSRLVGTPRPSRLARGARRRLLGVPAKSVPNPGVLFILKTSVYLCV